MTQRSFITPDGEYLGTWVNGTPRVEAIEVPHRPSENSTWNGTEWVTPLAVPSEISKVQFIRALRLTEFGGGTAWDAAKAALAAASVAIQEDWEAITMVPRQDATVLAMAAALGASEGLSDVAAMDMMDGVFILGSSL